MMGLVLNGNPQPVFCRWKLQMKVLFFFSLHCNEKLKFQSSHQKGHKMQLRCFGSEVLARP